MENAVDEAVHVVSNLNAVFITSLIFVIIFRQQLENIANAIVLYVSPKISVGNHVKVGKIKGRVISIGFNVTIKNERENYIAYVPSSTFVTQTVQNFTLGNGDNHEIYDL